MNLGYMILLTLILVIAVLDAWAIWQVKCSPYYESGQRRAQAVFIILVPILGALLAAYLASPTQNASFTPPSADDDAESVSGASNYDESNYH